MIKVNLGKDHHFLKASLKAFKYCFHIILGGQGWLEHSPLNSSASTTSGPALQPFETRNTSSEELEDKDLKTRWKIDVVSLKG